MTTPTARQQAILDSFDYHVPTPDQGARIGEVREAFRHCARRVMLLTPEGDDQTAALRQLHESMMSANKSIVLEPGSVKQPEPVSMACGAVRAGVACTAERGHDGPHTLWPTVDGAEPPPLLSLDLATGGVTLAD